ncbi:MAG: glycosyltransferase family 2 protein [Rhodocyclaceae bacterium]|nr:MAG: glycosyltransferase family 2 protein [Rhodocyclaceae bacterium]
MSRVIFNPCIVIPIYNHGASIGKTVRGLIRHGYPIYIVDDGSDLATRQALSKVQQHHAQVRLFHLPVNQGKGAAVMHGMRQAFSAGFTHALQIDADGQHATEDVPAFMALGQEDPEAVVCGKPIYDETIPKGRLYGRYVTHFWVWIETLSFDIGDSMCGFRLYPLEKTCRLIDEVQIPTRMDFDTEIVVRLAWIGIRILNLPTRVTYPSDGVSHFKMLEDNVRISKMHTRLFFGMLPRMPLILWRRATASRAIHWAKTKERGSISGMRFLMALQALLGERVTSWALHPIVMYFFLSSSTSRTASRKFLIRVAQLKGAPEPGWRETYFHMYEFAQSAMDKLSAWRGNIQSSQVDFQNREVLNELIQSKRGALLIGSHLGNLEMMRALASREHQITINAVVYSDNAMRFNSVMEEACEGFTVNLLQIKDFGPDTAIILKEKIDKGEWLVIVGDRTPPSENGRVVLVDFLGMQAAFAMGPVLLASLLECPVYLFFCVKKNGQYSVDVEKFAEKIELPRQNRLQAMQDWVQCYASRLGAHAMAAPLQWFNFFDIWQRAALLPKNRTKDTKS